MSARQTRQIQEEIEEALRSLKAVTDPAARRLLLQRMRRLIAEAETRNSGSSE